MSIKEQLEEDVSAFFENIEGQLPEARKRTLLNLIDKYAHLFSTPIMLTKYDFEMIKDHARKFLINSAFPKKIGSNRGEVHPSEANILSVIEGTITVLNGKECLRKLPKFDYRD